MGNDNVLTPSPDAGSAPAGGSSREREAFDLLNEVNTRIWECGRIDELDDEDLIERIDAYLSRPANGDAT